MVARMPHDYTIRIAEQADIEQFAEIVNHYIENSAINFHDRPQSEEDWEARVLQVKLRLLLSCTCPVPILLSLNPLWPNPKHS